MRRNSRRRARRAEQERFDRAHGDAVMGGDVLVGPALDLAEMEDVLVPGGQAGEGGDHQRGVHLVDDPLLLASVDRAGIGVGERLGTGLAPEVVDAQPGGDHRDPGVEAQFPAQVRQSGQGPGEGFLGDFLGGVDVADALQAEPLQAVVVAAVQLLEGVVVPGLEPLDECPVAGYVDIINP